MGLREEPHMVVMMHKALPLLALLLASASSSSPPGLRGPKSPRRLSEASWMPPRPTDLGCLRSVPKGCFTLHDRASCLGAKDGRSRSEWMGLQVHGEPCTWCGGGSCHNNNSNVCEPYDFLRHGLGVGFHAFLSTQLYEVASCKSGMPLLARGATSAAAASAQAVAAAEAAVNPGAMQDFQTRGMDAAPVLQTAVLEGNSGLCSAHPGCSALGLWGDCCPTSSGTYLSCCHQQINETAAPAAPAGLAGDDIGEGVDLAAAAEQAKAVEKTAEDTEVAWWQTPQPSTAEETNCLMDHRYGCNVIKHEATCLGSKDGRPITNFNGLKIHGQPCVWCGGVPCHSRSTSLCEPLDFLMGGEGKAFGTFFAKRTYQAATCKDGMPAPPQKFYRQPPPPPAPLGLQIDDSWWRTEPLPAEETSCLMEHRYGCNVIRNRETCLGSKDMRQVEEIDGVKIRGQPCAWCGGLACTSKNATQCEPLDLLMHGEGKLYNTFLAKATYQVARCKDGHPLPAEKVFRHLPMLTVPTLAPWWVPSTPPTRARMDCLRPLKKGCFAATSMGQCLSGKDASTVPAIHELAVSGQPCVWCGGGPCTSNSSAVCAPYDYALRGEGTAFSIFFPKTTYQVADCLERTAELPSHDFECLEDVPKGCASLKDAASCLGSRDGRPEEETDGGLKVKGQPCVWCGGASCTSANSNMCEPFDWLMNGKGKAFQWHVLEPTTFYRLAGCKNKKPAALNFLDYAQFVGGYFPPVLEAAPLVPFWVANKPTAEETTCLRPADQGCSAVTTMEQCMSSKDGRVLQSLHGLQIAGEPCVWCGGITCTTNSTSLCEPFDYVMYGQGKAFSDFTAKGVYKVAGCEKGDVQLPGYDYSCLAVSGLGGCASIWNAEECLASQDGRSTASVGVLQVRNQPCVWCGGGACHSGRTSMCEAFDYAVNGEGRAFARFHAQGTYRLAACRGGKPQAATLKNFTDFVPGYTFKPPPLPTVSPRERWWVPPRPSAQNTSCLKPQVGGCSALTDMGSCLSSSDGRPTTTVFGDLRVGGEACVWCGGGRCHSNGTSYCEPFDYLMRGEGVAFDLFYTPHNFKVASCRAHIPLPAKFNFSCLAGDNLGCDTMHDAATCLMSMDGRTKPTIDGMLVKGQPCVWCGGTPCNSGSAALCQAFDYAMNGEGQVFNYFHGKLNYAFAGCKDGFPAGMTYDGFAPYIQGYVHPGYNKPEKILPYWVPVRPSEEDLVCLEDYAGGCDSITEMSTCLSSRDGRNVERMHGLQIGGEPCVWCNGGICATGSQAKCMPFDYAMRGEGRAFANFLAKASFRVAGCYNPYTKPSYDYSCLKPMASGCSAITNPYDCLGGTDGRSDTMIDGLKVHGEPCVWCGGGLCHTKANTMCEPFDYVMNGAGRSFFNFHAKLTYRIAACQDGHPQGATLEGFQNFIPGAIPTVKPFWWITQPKPQGEELTCLMNHRFGCHVVKHRETCLGSKDGRAVQEWNGLKIHGEPCVWCGGMPCQTNSTNLCEPYDFLMHGEGKAFWQFTAKTSYNVARCKDGSPLLPDRAEASSKDLHFSPSGSSSGTAGQLPLPEASDLGGVSAEVANGQKDTVGKDCWYECGEKGGACAWCGEGRACCRSGWDNPAECAGADYTQVGSHECVGMAAVPQSGGVYENRLGKDCWDECGETGGRCGWCGAGMACCRNGWGSDPAECSGVAYTAEARHECVAITASGGSGFSAGAGSGGISGASGATGGLLGAGGGGAGVPAPFAVPGAVQGETGGTAAGEKEAAAAQANAGEAAAAGAAVAGAEVPGAGPGSSAQPPLLTLPPPASAGGATLSPQGATLSPPGVTLSPPGATLSPPSSTLPPAASEDREVAVPTAATSDSSGDTSSDTSGDTSGGKSGDTSGDTSGGSSSSSSSGSNGGSSGSSSGTSSGTSSGSGITTSSTTPSGGSFSALPEGQALPWMPPLGPVGLATSSTRSPLTTGEDCWVACGHAAGECPGYCGKGVLCCKRGSPSDPEVCQAASWPSTASLVHHQCVVKSDITTTESAGAASGFALRTTASPATAYHDVVVPPPTLPGEGGVESESNVSYRNDTNITLVAAVTSISSHLPVWFWILLLLLLLALCVPLLGFLLQGKGRSKGGKARKSVRASHAQSTDSGEDTWVPASGVEMQEPLVAQDRSLAVGKQAQGQEGDLFDILDANHDGVITTSEFNRALGTATAPMGAAPAAPVQTSAVPVQTARTLRMPHRASALPVQPAMPVRPPPRTSVSAAPAATGAPRVSLAASPRGSVRMEPVATGVPMLQQRQPGIPGRGSVVPGVQYR